jgi:hypothetical protein
MAIIKQTKVTNGDEDAEKVKPLLNCWWECKLVVMNSNMEIPLKTCGLSIPVVPATQETEVGGSWFQACRCKVSVRPI